MKSHTQRMGLVGAGLSIGIFALCMVWGIFITDAVLKTLHLNILQIIYPGFAFTVVGIIIGVAEAIVYGFLFGILFVWLGKVCGVNHQK